MVASVFGCMQRWWQHSCTLVWIYVVEHMWSDFRHHMILVLCSMPQSPTLFALSYQPYQSVRPCAKAWRTNHDILLANMAWLIHAIACKLDFCWILQAIKGSDAPTLSWAEPIRDPLLQESGILFAWIQLRLQTCLQTLSNFDNGPKTGFPNMNNTCSSFPTLPYSTHATTNTLHPEPHHDWTS
jgi:hypothetical protein